MSVGPLGWISNLARAGAALGLCLAAVACETKPEFVWRQFNADGDVIEVEVGTPDLGPPVTIDLHSSTGQHVVGQATIDPGSGPVGTRHTLIVTVGEQFDPTLEDDPNAPLVDLVERVSVEVDAGERGIQDWNLRQDSAAPQTWVIELESLGSPNEPPRTDRLTILLWEVVATEEGPAEAEAAQ